MECRTASAHCEELEHLISHVVLVVVERFWLTFVRCEEVGVVKRVHTLLGGVHRLATALKAVEEVQEEVQEIKDE